MITEIEHEAWARSMKQLLCLANKYCHRYYPQTIPKPIITRIERLYQSIICRGLNFHDSQPPLTRKGNRGRLKRRVGHNLLLRLPNFRSDVLCFLDSVNVPVTNNQAERDLRMMKCKQRCDPAPLQGARERAPREKISGCFRRAERAVDLANIRSVLSTAKKRCDPASA